MRIAHITDLHVACSPTFGEYNAKRLLGYVNYRLFRSRRYRERIAREALHRMMDNSRPDLVLLTGDITQHGLDAEFEGAEELLSIITDRGIPIIAVPGNHDIYGQFDRERLRAFLDRVALSLQHDEMGMYRLSGVEILPLAQGVPTPLFLSYGRQNPRELELATKIWAEPPHGIMRLVCGHYPVIDPHGGRLMYFHGLREAGMLIDFCREHKVAGYFCGHNHKRFAARMPGGCMQYAAPALSAVRNAASEWVSVYECDPAREQPLDVGGEAASRDT